MADTRKQGGARRPRTAAAARQTLDRLLKARDEVDAAVVDRRHQEEAALARYAEADVRAQALTSELERLVADLQRQIEAARDKNREQLVDVDQDKSVALLTLTELGRSAEELANMTGVGAKRIRAMVRAARTARSEVSGAGDDVAADQSVTTVVSGSTSRKEATNAPKQSAPDQPNTASQIDSA